MACLWESASRAGSGTSRSRLARNSVIRRALVPGRLAWMPRMSASRTGASAPIQASTIRRLRVARRRTSSSHPRARACSRNSASSAFAAGVSDGSWSSDPTAMQLQSRRASNSTPCPGTARCGETGGAAARLAAALARAFCCGAAYPSVPDLTTRRGARSPPNHSWVHGCARVSGPCWSMCRQQALQRPSSKGIPRRPQRVQSSAGWPWCLQEPQLLQVFRVPQESQYSQLRCGLTGMTAREPRGRGGSVPARVSPAWRSTSAAALRNLGRSSSASLVMRPPPSASRTARASRSMRQVPLHHEVVRLRSAARATAASIRRS